MHFFYSSGITHFPFKWLPFIVPSPRVTVNDFFIEERCHVDVLDKLPSNINTLSLEGIRCIELICHMDDLAVLQ